MFCGESIGGGCEGAPCGLFGKDSMTLHSEKSLKTNPEVSLERILAADLEKLSLREREKVYEDVHGVSDVIEETPELVASCLEQMDREIEAIKKKDAYEQAVINRQVLLAFLRKTSFNPKKAALHLVEYYRIKLEMFGKENLAKFGITLEDIGKEATRALELGSLQVLPNRDSKGRVVVVAAAPLLEPAMDSYDDPIPIITRMFYYLMSTLNEDEESQKKGVVVVVSGSGLSERHAKFHRAYVSSVLAFAESFPIRLAGFHYYYTSPSSFSLMLLSVMASAANSIVRVRVRTHHGSYTECLYSLMPFGIPIQEFPFTADGGVQLANHVKWMEQRRKKEAYLSKYPPIEGAVILPSNYDVLWGRGKHRHPGNRLLHELVETYYDQYNRLSRDGRTNLADQLLEIVHGFSGRFMKLDKESGMWVEVSRVEARDKVTHRFRHSRAVDLKGGSTRDNELIVAKSEKDPDGGGKRPRMMFHGS